VKNEFDKRDRRELLVFLLGPSVINQYRRDGFAIALVSIGAILLTLGLVVLPCEEAKTKTIEESPAPSTT
jgi:hypothetical protein